MINLDDSSDQEDKHYDMIPQENSDNESEDDNHDIDLGCKQFDLNM